MSRQLIGFLPLWFESMSRTVWTNSWASFWLIGQIKASMILMLINLSLPLLNSYYNGLWECSISSPITTPTSYVTRKTFESGFFVEWEEKRNIFYSSEELKCRIRTWQCFNLLDIETFIESLENFIAKNWQEFLKIDKITLDSTIL